MVEAGCLVVDLGMCDYAEALSLQMRAHRARRENRVTDLLLLLQHPHVITIGAAGSEADLLLPREALMEEGIAVFQVARGGRVTYHGPGQLVAYPIVDLSRRSRDVHLYLRKLEEVIMLTLSDYGIAGQRMDGLTGVWVGERKMACIGVEVRKWVTMHGFALNVNPSLSFFSYIVPCGVRDKGVTSMLQQSRCQIEIADVQDRLVRRFAEVFDIKEDISMTRRELETIV